VAAETRAGDILDNVPLSAYTETPVPGEIEPRFRRYLRKLEEAARDGGQRAIDALWVGAIGRAWSVPELLQRRLFAWRFELGEWLSDCYFARIPTRRMPRCRQHTLKYAV
jgi:hypothetical protein